MKTRRIATIFLVLACFMVVPADVIQIRDDFDDGNMLSNTKGIGHGWNKGTWNQCRVLEANGVVDIPVMNELGNGWFQNKKADNFPVWTTGGATVTWVVKSMTVQTPHYWGMYLAYHVDMGIISGHASNEVPNYAKACSTGLFYITLGKKDNSADTRASIVISNKTHPADEHSPVGIVEVAGFNFNAVFPVIVTATLTRAGWNVSLNQNVGAQKLSGNWTTDLRVNGIDASITNEFADSAFVLAAGRNSGITGAYTGEPFPQNDGQFERIEVKLNGITAPAPGIPPAGSPIWTFSNLPQTSIYNVFGSVVPKAGSFAHKGNGIIFVRQINGKWEPQIK